MALWDNCKGGGADCSVNPSAAYVAQWVRGGPRSETDPPNPLPRAPWPYTEIGEHHSSFSHCSFVVSSAFRLWHKAPYHLGYVRGFLFGPPCRSLFAPIIYGRRRSCREMAIFLLLGSCGGVGA
ncbi:uncharacterized protein TM35_000372100 [Trypanosoma theileri]|uniref:Uncharacterized protein n=1 Tax=Trypanosoma theileri TaxID=67003 RepID=A0A1X0NKR0_9TRYP|nr:uncharacterized protein TM35_000372100 [Trypanosoma theileri]ORC85237.1 hypothetical protein TM35_000372100 [Trypanosoma theileri]